jgi:hypothetical protein
VTAPAHKKGANVRELLFSAPNGPNERTVSDTSSVFSARIFGLGVVLGLLISAGVFVLIGELMT